MSTHLTLEDGRVLGATNGAEWLLEQRCEVLGPGIGYLDVRELSPRAAREFREAFTAACRAGDFTKSPELLRAEFSLLFDMWESIARGESPETLTSPHWLMMASSGARRGPGW
jgi:hypothetical protein